MITAIQASTTPVVLISADALFLLTLANRYNHITTRIRQLSDLVQIESLFCRMNILKTAILLNIISFILQIIVVAIILLLSIFQWDGIDVVGCIFFTSLMTMMASAIVFSIDIFHSSFAIQKYIQEMRAAR